jgi:hypothetical protein
VELAVVAGVASSAQACVVVSAKGNARPTVQTGVLATVVDLLLTPFTCDDKIWEVIIGQAIHLRRLHRVFSSLFLHRRVLNRAERPRHSHLAFQGSRMDAAHTR